MKYLVLGIENRTSKKGEIYHLLHVAQPFNDQKYGIGQKTSIEYVSKKAYPVGLKIGDTIEFTYGKSFDGKAYVNGARIVGDEIPTISKNNK